MVGQSGATTAGSSMVAHSVVVCGTDQSVSGISMRDTPQTGHAVASTGNDLATTDRFMETLGMVPVFLQDVYMPSNGNC